MKLIKKSEATASRRRVYFHLVGADGITPVTTQAGGQPQISTDGGAWTDTGIGVLVAIGNGRYYAELTTGAVATVGSIIETRFKSGSTAECPGDSVQVVGFDPDIANEAAINFVLGKKTLVNNGDGTYTLNVYTAADANTLYKSFLVNHPVSPSSVVPQ